MSSSYSSSARVNEETRTKEDETQPPKRIKAADDNLLLNIKKQVQRELLKDIVVGFVNHKEDSPSSQWLNKCEIVPGTFIDLLNPDTSKLTLTQSPFGYKTETVVDLAVRNCKEVSLAQCDRRLRMLAQSIVGDQQQKYCEPYKLVVYEEGGHFEQHTDTEQPGLTHSLVMHLPTNCEGGDLMFQSWNSGKDFTENKINYILFGIKHPHKVTPVIKGERVSLLFKVFDFESVPWKNSIDGEYCYSIIEIPKHYKNVLFEYPNIKVLERVLEASKLEFLMVYYDCNFDSKPKEVFIDLLDKDELSDTQSIHDHHDFDALTENATKFPVEHVVDLGLPCEMKDDYTRHWGYTGNEAYSVSTNIIYNMGCLVNPQKPK